MACDCCGKATNELQPVNKIYATAEIQMICADCEKIITKQIRKVMSLTHRIHCSLVEAFMVNRRKESKGA